MKYYINELNNNDSNIYNVLDRFKIKFTFYILILHNDILYISMLRLWQFIITWAYLYWLCKGYLNAKIFKFDFWNSNLKKKFQNLINDLILKFDFKRDMWVIVFIIKQQQ